MKEIASGITLDEAVPFGKPVLAGTRVPLDLMLGKLAGGMTVEEDGQEYELRTEALRAALAFSWPSGLRRSMQATSARSLRTGLRTSDPRASRRR